nr:tyrosine-type recombinase/integrase [Thalassobacillus sp. CUG 92003]
MKKELTPGRDRLLFIIGINSGLRISDVLPLRVKDVRDQKAITVREGKTGKTRTFALNQAIQTAVSENIPADEPDDNLLFPSRKGNKPITRTTAWRILNTAAERAGVEKIGTHSLRKTMGYHAYQNGVDLTVIQAILNHASQRETLRYIGIVQDDIDNVFNAINL